MSVVTREPLTPYLSGRELRELLGVSRECLRLWRKRGLPHVGGLGTGVMPRYRVDQVNAWLEARRPSPDGPEAA